MIEKNIDLLVILLALWLSSFNLFEKFLYTGLSICIDNIIKIYEG